jgi:hypothetical protein
MSNGQPRPYPAATAAPPADDQIPATPPPAALAVTMNPGASPPGMLPLPRLVINGRELTVSWGRTVVPVPPGHHRVQAYLPHLLIPRSNYAACATLVAPGWITELQYRCSMWTFGGPGSVRRTHLTSRTSHHRGRVSRELPTPEVLQTRHIPPT